MARVEIQEPREQAAHFGLYRTSAGGQQFIIVRRKIGEPTDYKHTKSRKLARQRDNLALASQHYAQLTPSQKAITRHQFEEVEFIKSHGKSDIKLLSGRQLFISKEIRSLNVTQKQLVLPHELCIMLVNADLFPLPGTLWLRYLKDAEWRVCKKDEISTGSWLFSSVPREQEAYRPYGEAEGWFDPQLPQHQNMTEDEIRAYKYHVLYSEAVSYWISHSSNTQNYQHLCVAGKNFSTIRVWSRHWLYDYEGRLDVAIWKYYYPYLPENELARRSFYISAGAPDPKYFDLFLSGFNLSEGSLYAIRFLRLDPPYPYWKGDMGYQEIS